MTNIKENNLFCGESMEHMFRDVLDTYRDIEELQTKINSIYEKAKTKMNGEYDNEYEKEFDKGCFECIQSYVRN